MTRKQQIYEINSPKTGNLFKLLRNKDINPWPPQNRTAGCSLLGLLVEQVFQSYNVTKVTWHGPSRCNPIQEKEDHRKESFLSKFRGINIKNCRSSYIIKNFSFYEIIHVIVKFFKLQILSKFWIHKNYQVPTQSFHFSSYSHNHPYTM